LSKQDYNELQQKFKGVPVIEKFDTNSLNTLKMIEEQLYNLFSAKEMQRSKILNLAHELKLPIQSIAANAENLKSTLTKKREEASANEAEWILNQVLRLSIIVDNIHSNLSDNRNEKFFFEYLAISDLIPEISSIFIYEAREKKIDFVYNIEPQTLQISKQLNRAFTNLIHNAVKYSYYGSEANKRFIEIVGKVDRDRYKLSITNYGVGIFEHELNMVFLDGYRGSLSSERERTGSGIGLTEAKRIIEKHGGKIEINSIPMSADIFNGPYKTYVIVHLPRDAHGKM
jgi:signal transduction histidine kinase